MKKNFCAVPWSDLSVIPSGHYSLCCVQKHSEDTKKISMNSPVNDHWNSAYMKNIRKQFAQGILPKTCEGCAINQSLGLEYRRERMNKRYIGISDPPLDHPAVHTLLKQTEEDGSFPLQIRGVEIGGDDTCQLRCITCSPAYSSSILKDYEKLGWPYERKNKLQVPRNSTGSHEALYDNLKPLIGTLEWIKFIGGEPSISKSLNKFIDWCIENDHAKKLTVLCTTNGAGKMDIFINKLKKFKKAIVGISLDGIGELEEWMRYPTNWEKKIENIKYITKEIPDSFISHVLCTINAHKLENLIEYCVKNQYNFYIERLNWPDELSIKNFPYKTKLELENYFSQINKNFKEISYTKKDTLLTSSYLNEFIEKTKKFMMYSESNEEQWNLNLDTIREYNKIRKKTLGSINQFYNFL